MMTTSGCYLGMSHTLHLVLGTKIVCGVSVLMVLGLPTMWYGIAKVDVSTTCMQGLHTM